MRPVALGRKNWVHIGSPQAGAKIAAILSVLESCRRLKLSVREYLAAILPGLANVTIQRLPALIPAVFATCRGKDSLVTSRGPKASGRLINHEAFPANSPHNR